MLLHLAMLLLILGVFLLFPREWRRNWPYVPLIDACLVTALAAIIARYLWWRFTVTVWPVEGISAQSIFIWTLFWIEMLAWVDAGTLFLALMRRTDRSAEADLGEARLRACPPEKLPQVDVFIATYNEPMEVLEKTMIGALSLDWPADKLRVYALDDGRRAWLRQYCDQTGVIHMTRADNAHAKAGNINAAIKRTDAPFFLVLDADFVPQKNFLYRAIGFFDDPKIGIVQIPHNFFNGDPMQSNLGIRKTLPDDQRFFFDAIMPGRDGWNCAFCCGSNALTRRSAMDAVGGGLPTGSITEDMLLTLALLRKGYFTRYLNERLAVGLAAESLPAFFVQRARWAQGAIQILYLRDGPLGPNLKWYQRLFFLPTHWITQSLSQIAAMTTPAIYLWTGLLPLVGADFRTVLSYQLPAILGTLVALRILAPGQFFPLAATAHGVLQAFRLLPTIALTLVKPHGHKFKVTPKGSDAADGSGADQFTLALAIGLMLITAFGLIVNTNFDSRIIVSVALVPVVACWAIYNMVVLSIVATIAVSPPMLRSEERFALDEPCRIRLRNAAWAGEISDISLSGLSLDMATGYPGVAPEVGDWIAVEIARVGPVPALVRRVRGREVAAQFAWMQDPPRRALIQRLFTEGLDNSTHNDDGLVIAWRLLATVLTARQSSTRPPEAVGTPPDWLTRVLSEPIEEYAVWSLADATATDQPFSIIARK